MTLRCSRCDIAHDDTTRCPTDLEYERGYRNGTGVGAEKITRLERELSQSACANASLRQQLAESRALVAEASERDEKVYWLSRDWHNRAAEAGGDRG